MPHQSRKALLQNGGAACNMYMLKEVLDLLDVKKREGVGPREIRLWMFVWRLNLLDALNTAYEVDFVVYAQWEESVSKLVVGEKETGPWRRQNFKWLPDLTFPHLVEKMDGCADVFSVREDLESDWITKEIYQSWRPVLSKKDTVVVQQTLRRRGKVSGWPVNWGPSTCGHAQYPFDWHALPLCVSTSRSYREVLLRFHNNLETVLSGQIGASLKKGYSLHGPFLVAYNNFVEPLASLIPLPLLSLPNWSHTQSMHSQLYLTPVIFRRWPLLVLKTLLPTLLLSLLGFGVFLIENMEEGMRFAWIGLLLMAMFAHRFTLINTLPDFGFFTWVDLYHLVTLCQLVVFCGVSAIPAFSKRERVRLATSVNQYTDEEEFAFLQNMCRLDHDVSQIMAFLWCCIHVAFIMGIIRQIQQRLHIRKLAKSEKERWRKVRDPLRDRGSSHDLTYTHKELQHSVKKRYSLFAKNEEVKDELSVFSYNSMSEGNRRRSRHHHRVDRRDGGSHASGRSPPSMSYSRPMSWRGHKEQSSMKRIKGYESDENTSPRNIPASFTKYSASASPRDILDGGAVSPTPSHLGPSNDLRGGPHTHAHNSKLTKKKSGSFPSLHTGGNAGGTHLHGMAAAEAGKDMRFMLSPDRICAERKHLEPLSDTVQTLVQQEDRGRENGKESISESISLVKSMENTFDGT